jgi:hypothetical protein
MAKSRRFTAEEKLAVLQYWDQHGEEAVISQYQVPRRTLYYWKKQQAQPKNRKPKAAPRNQHEGRILAIVTEHPKASLRDIKALLNQEGIQLSPGSILKVLQGLELSEMHQRIALLEELKINGDIVLFNSEQNLIIQRYGLWDFSSHSFEQKKFIIIKVPIGHRFLLMLIEVHSLYTWMKLGYIGDEHELRIFLYELIGREISSVGLSSILLDVSKYPVARKLKARILLIFKKKINWNSPVEKDPFYYDGIAGEFNRQPQKGYLRNQSPLEIISSLKTKPRKRTSGPSR